MTSFNFAFLALATVTSVLSDPIVIPLQKRTVSEYINTEYVGRVKLGDQYFECVFDTSAYTTVVPTSSCVSGGCKCVNVHKYHPSASTKTGPQNNVQSVPILNSGYANGTEAHDSIEISSLSAPSQGFLLATDISTDICTLNTDGVVGMGRPGSGKAAFNLPTPLETFVNQGDIYPGFSFHHARYPNGLHFGVLVLGGILDRYYKGDITYVPLVDDTTWNFKVDSIKVGDVEVLGNTLAYIDTSKYIVVGPASQVNKLNQLLGCTNTVHGSETLCVFDCDKTDGVPSITFNIGSFVMNISSEYHIQQSGDLCYSGLVPKEGITSFAMGDFVIDNYWQYFDPSNKRIGFAVSSEKL